MRDGLTAPNMLMVEKALNKSTTEPYNKCSHNSPPHTMSSRAFLYTDYLAACATGMSESCETGYLHAHGGEEPKWHRSESVRAAGTLLGAWQYAKEPKLFMRM